MTAALFCSHKRLRTSCPECRPPPPPPPAAPVVKAKPAKAVPKATHDDEDLAKPAAGSTATRARPKRIKAPTRAEAENAEAWWVKKG